MGKILFLFKIFFTTLSIERSEMLSIMGALQFLGVKSMTHANDKSRNSIGGKLKIIQINGAKLYSIRHNHIREVYGNGEII